ncbi:alkaline phosphatase-like protein [Rozella allomycis CSF55]|uniref:Alkaline phosphatase n=1 Tax=Rozella allomycis (strain CSF55) TaxID=988480 RepID=A0A4P9YLA6_ROZAC|nr:alkaline phosphatase-like protein [Rozella allomycis CSF55]
MSLFVFLSIIKVLSSNPINVILMISDGFGPSSETFGRTIYQFKNNLPFDHPTPLDEILVGTSRTRSSSSLVTDSAAGATAFSCGLKSYNGAIGAAKAKGLKTGLVATSRITHATPASFSAHVVHRDMENLIAEYQPDDWNEEEDGKWEAPLVENPKCNSGKCGVWQRRKISNPNYRGKWKRPLISNPNYKGKWSPKKIPNPEYFEDDKIYKFTPMVTFMHNDILFDNIFISDSIQDAEKFSDETFKLKSKEEALKEPKEEESTVEDKQESSFEDSSSFGPYLDALKNIDISKIVELLKTEPMTFIPFFAAVFFPILIVYFVKWAISNPVSDSKEKIESDDGFQEEQNDEVETNEIKTQEEKEDNSLNQVNAQSDESTDNE